MDLECSFWQFNSSTSLATLMYIQVSCDLWGTKQVKCARQGHNVPCKSMETTQARVCDSSASYSAHLSITSLINPGGRLSPRSKSSAGKDERHLRCSSVVRRLFLSLSTSFFRKRICRIMFSGESISMDTSLGEGGAETGWSNFSWRILV